MNDIEESFLMQASIDNFQECGPNDLRKIIVEYSTINADMLKVLVVIGILKKNS